MTCLSAFWSFDRRDPLGAVQKMLRAQQIYASSPPAVLSCGEFALGRALWRINPEDQHDAGPVVGGGGRWALIADVRLDARDELCSELGIMPSEAKAFSDAMLVMRAIERWGEDAIPRLLGDFALALWDAKEETLILARDFQGRRPLHYHEASTFFAVASMPKGLHALAAIPREPDQRAMAEFLALLPERSTRSFFAGIGRVLPGEIVRVRRRAMARRNYWDFQPKPLRLRDDEYVEAVREVFERAVAARLRGAGKMVGAHLSGGLDSTTVAATAARLIEGTVVGFTAAPRKGSNSQTFHGRFNDETAHAAAVAALYPNMRQEVIRGARQSPLAALDRNFFLYDRPVLNLCNAVWLDGILDGAKHNRLKVLLTGEFGNMTISYAGLESLGRLASDGHLLRLACEAVLLRRNGTRLRSVFAHAVGPFLPASIWIAINRAAGRHFDITEYSAIDPKVARALQRDALARGTDFSCRPRRDPFELRKWVLSLIDDGNFLKGALAGWGVDVRDPTVDRRVVELCLSIPAEQFLKNGQTRSLARRAFADRLPTIVVQEKSKGYQAADWHEGLCDAWTEAASEAIRIAKVPIASKILDTARMGRLLERRTAVDWNSFGAETEYRLALLRGLSAGHFLRRASGANC